MVQGVGGSGEGVGGLGFGFGSVWLRDLGMQLCFGFASDVFAKLHIYLINWFDFYSLCKFSEFDSVSIMIV